MCICIYVYEYVYVSVCVCVYVHVHVYVYVCMCMYSYRNVCIYIYTYMYIHVCMLCVYVYIYIYICIYIHTYVYIHIHVLQAIVTMETTCETEVWKARVTHYMLYVIHKGSIPVYFGVQWPFIVGCLAFKASSSTASSRRGKPGSSPDSKCRIG